MADAVTTTVIYQDTVRYVVKITNLSDGTGESAVTKVDKSTLVGPNGLEPSELVVEVIDADVVGMTVKIYADHTTDVPIAMIGGGGAYCRDFRKTGGLSTSGAGETGDILLTTAGHTANDSYDITLYLRKKD